ncbi:Unknown protein, partial [Striga hermonthica]
SVHPSPSSSSPLPAEGLVKLVELRMAELGRMLKAQGQRMRVDLYALPLKATDIVLGCQWLETLGPITTDYWKGTMEFGGSSKRVKLRTEDPGGSLDEDNGDGRGGKLNFLILGDKEGLEEEGNDTKVALESGESSEERNGKRCASALDAHEWADKPCTRVWRGVRGRKMDGCAGVRGNAVGNLGSGGSWDVRGSGGEGIGRQGRACEHAGVRQNARKKIGKGRACAASR